MNFPKKYFVLLLAAGIARAENSLFPPETWMRRFYERIGQDENEMRAHGADFLRSRYSDYLDQHNLKRFQDFSSVYDSIAKKRIAIAVRYKQVEDENPALNAEPSEFASLPPSQYAQFLLEQASHLQATNEIAGKLEALAKEGEDLLALWNERGAEHVIDALDDELEMTRYLPEPHIAIPPSYDGFSFAFEAGYKGSTQEYSNKNFTFSFKDTPMVTLLTVLKGVSSAVGYSSDGSDDHSQSAAVAAAIAFGIDSFRKLNHEDKVYKLISGYRDLIRTVRAEASADQRKLIAESIALIMDDTLKDGSKFSDSLARSLQDTKDFLAHVNSIRERKRTLVDAGEAEFMKKLQTMIKADTGKIVNKIMGDLKTEDKVLRAFDREAWAYRAKSPRPDTISDAVAGYEALVGSMEQDAYFSQKYLAGVVYRDPRDFYFNEHELLATSYPLGPWRTWAIDTENALRNIK